MIVEVNAASLPDAAKIHSESWCDSHSAFCSREFLALHTPGHQQQYLQSELDAGKRLYMLVSDKPVGIVSVKDDLIENLYVLPSEQRRGFGTELLLFAESQCSGTPRLWILNNNRAAFALYSKHGYILTGKTHKLSGLLFEEEMQRQPR